MNAEFFIARRYLFSKRKISFITIISAISIVGVTIGVAAMIIVLSVFNGFNKKVTSILIGFDPHLRVEAVKSGKIENPESVMQSILACGVENAAPFTLTKGMLATKEINKVSFIKGVDDARIDKVSGIKKYVKYGSFNLSDDGEFGGIVLGFSLAGSMKVFIGDTLTIVSPVGLEYSLTQFVEPITKKFLVRGIYDSDNRDYDSKYAYISIDNAQKLFKLGGAVSGIEVRLNDISASDKIKLTLQSALDVTKYNVLTWYDLHSDFYSILKVERWTAFIILSLIIAVASFNILGSLTMTVIEKKRDIGILKSMGASDKMITRIFMFEGIVVGLIGMIIGSALGFSITLAQLYFKFYKMDASVYKIDALPVDLRAGDFIFVPLAALVLCFLASLYPSRRAAKLKPVESIRWE
ncbi:ABC transporter permease [bacterium]|nr:MAG: ABC transporter permease [bacterium]